MTLQEWYGLPCPRDSTHNATERGHPQKRVACAWCLRDKLEEINGALLQLIVEAQHEKSPDWCTKANIDALDAAIAAGRIVVFK